MRRLSLCLFSIVALSGIASASDEPAQRTTAQIIRAKPDAPWGGQIEDVEKVLHSSADTLWRYFPERELKPILVEPKGGPIALYERGPGGEFQVRLNTGDRLWAQHAFQFAHEFCHILCNHRAGPNRNKWFEESLCETASLFALRRMAESWQTEPPYPNWKSYSTSLAAYVDDRLKNASRAPDESLADWHRAHEDQLSLDAVNREHNLIIAAALLPLFEKQPQHWEAVDSLNGPGPLEAQSFTAYLDEWRRRCPVRHQPFVEVIAEQFEIIIPVQPNPDRDRIKLRYDQQIEILTNQIRDLRKQRDAELKQLFEQELKQRAAARAKSTMH